MKVSSNLIAAEWVRSYPDRSEESTGGVEGDLSWSNTAGTLRMIYNFDVRV